MTSSFRLPYLWENMFIIYEQHVAQWLALLKAPGDWVRFLAWVTVRVEFAHSPHVCVGFLWVFQIPPTV